MSETLSHSEVEAFEPYVVRSINDFVEASALGDDWPARHNQEIWGAPPSGLYEALPPPCGAQALR